MLFDGLFKPAAIAANWTEAVSNRIPYLGEGLFPARKQRGLDLSWIKGSKGLPVSLMPSAFDAKATFRDRIGVTKLDTEMPFFREGFMIKERDRQDLLRVQSANDPYAAAVIANVFDDANNLIEGALVASERMRMQLLFPVGGNVGISIKANGMDYTYDYDAAVNGTRQWKSSNYFALTGNALWSADSTADPFADIQTAQNAIRAKTGAELAYAIMNSVTFNYLMKTAAIKNRYITKNGLAIGYLTSREVQATIQDVTGVSIVVYDKQFKDESGVTAKFVPDGYVSLVPAGAVGRTNYGTTPEEADLIGGGKAEVSIVNTGIALTQVVEPHPVNVSIFASEIVLPSYEEMDSVAVLKVLA